jgi:hypothetical protein
MYSVVSQNSKIAMYKQIWREVIKQCLVEEGKKEQRFEMEERAYPPWKEPRLHYVGRRICLAIK